MGGALNTYRRDHLPCEQRQHDEEHRYADELGGRGHGLADRVEDARERAHGGTFAWSYSSTASST